MVVQDLSLRYKMVVDVLPKSCGPRLYELSLDSESKEASTLTGPDFLLFY